MAARKKQREKSKTRPVSKKSACRGASHGRAYGWGKIFLDKEGRWFHEGVEITHQRTIELFNRSIKKQPGKGYYLQVGRERAEIEVEDTPFMVRAVDFRDRQAVLVLNDKTSEPLDPASLRVGKHNVLYCKVKSGQFPARFLRPAYYQLMSCLGEDEQGFFLEIGGQKWRIAQAAAD